MKLSSGLIAGWLVLTSSCATSRTETTIVEFPVGGVVTSGPTCPVQQDPPDPACDDRPVSGARLSIRDADGDPYGEVTTDSEGRFQIRLPEGSYLLEPQPVEGLMGTAQPVEFDVGPNLPVDIAIQYDTGIR